MPASVASHCQHFWSFSQKFNGTHNILLYIMNIWLCLDQIQIDQNIDGIDLFNQHIQSLHVATSFIIISFGNIR